MKAALLLVALALGGCCNCGPLDARAYSSEERPGDVVRALRDAVLAGDLNAASAHFSGAVPARAELPRWFEPGDEVTWVTVEGDTARVTVEHERRGGPTRFELRRHGERWKIVAWQA